jgi:hypothetical protein
LKDVRYYALIKEAMTKLGGRASIQEVFEYIKSKRRSVNRNTISTAMSDLSVNGPPSSLYHMSRRFLFRIGRGQYELYDIRKHKAKKDITRPPPLKGKPMLEKKKVQFYVYRDSDKLLQKKQLFEEVKDILQSIRRVNHREIQAEFHNRGWSLEKQIFTETSWAWDAYKDKVAVSVELSLIDAVHRDFLRAILAQKRGDLDALVYVTSTFKEPKFHNVRRDIEIFRDILTVPILLVGLT